MCVQASGEPIPAFFATYSLSCVLCLTNKPAAGGLIIPDLYSQQIQQKYKQETPRAERAILSPTLNTLTSFLHLLQSCFNIAVICEYKYTTLLTKGKHDKMESSLFSFSMKTFILIRVKGAFMNYNLPYVQHVMPFRETMK